MNTDSIDAILLQLQDAKRNGKPLTPEQLCIEHPELLEEVQRRWQESALHLDASTPADLETPPLDEDLLDELLTRLRQANEQGQPLSPEDACAEHPAMLDEVPYFILVG